MTWVRVLDEESQSYYYFNKVTKVVQWEEPPDYIDVEAMQKALNDPSTWVTIRDKASNEDYYYNKVTKDTTWVKPKCLESSSSQPSAPPPVVGKDIRNSNIDEKNDMKSDKNDVKSDPKPNLPRQVSKPEAKAERKEEIIEQKQPELKKVPSTAPDLKKVPSSAPRLETESSSKDVKGKAGAPPLAKQPSVKSQAPGAPALNSTKSEEKKSEPKPAKKNDVKHIDDGDDDDDAGDDDDEPDMVGSWRRVTDKNSGKEYWYDTVTKKTSWSLPSELKVRSDSKDNTDEEDVRVKARTTHTFGDSDEDDDIANPRNMRKSTQGDDDDIEDLLFEKATAEALSRETLKQMAQEFADRLPEGKFSPATIQGYLLTRKREPSRALEEACAWRDEQLEAMDKKR